MQTATQDLSQTIEFPEATGKPIGETGVHVRQILDLLATLRIYLRNRPDVFVGANMFMYFDPTDPRHHVCPDLFVACGVRPGERRSWKTWDEYKVPDLIIEVTSTRTLFEDTREKRALYQDLGVREYYLFDPLDEFLRPQLQGYHQIEGVFQPLAGSVLTSEVLGIELRTKADGQLHLYDPGQEEWLLTPEELFYKAQAEYARAEAERARADAAEAELVRLRQKIVRLCGEKRMENGL